MNSDRIYDVIEEIAASSGKAKQDILKSYSVDKELRNVLVAALNPFVTYGIAQIPPYEPRGANGEFDTDTWMLLHRLETRKLTGKNAHIALGAQLAALKPKSAELLKRIITKDLRAGIRASTVNKVMKGLIPKFDCMLAHKYEEKRIKQWPVLVEPKLDGVRVLCFVNVADEEVKFTSRTGKEFTTFDHLKPAVLEEIKEVHEDLMDEYFRHVVLDGEVVSGSFNKTVSEVRKKDTQADDAEFHVFHMLSYEEFAAGKGDLEIHEARKLLEDHFGKSFDGSKGLRLLQSYNVHSHEEIMQICQSIWDKGGEGVIVKDPSKPYVCKRNHAWMKIKAENSEDLRVVDAFEGTGKYEGSLGGLIVDRNGVEVRVGGGFSDDQRKEFWKVYQSDMEKLGSSDMSTRELIGRLIEVEYHEETPDGSLRHPRFVRFRDDKDQEAA